jgi:Cu(I)/Ag(I) efflux system periplasmic protein CusF
MRLALVLALVIPSAALAQAGVPSGASNEPGYTVPGSRYQSRNPPMEPGRSFRGEVKRVNKVLGTVTLRHGPITVLGVPERTEQYEVKDKALLEHVKAGDEVRFTAVLQGRTLVVTNIGPAN